MSSLSTDTSTNNAGFTPVAPAEPLAPWLGGKKRLARAITARIEATPHRCYAEPFCGMGGVFLRRRMRPKSEILNDINCEIVNLFRILRDHPDALTAGFDLPLASRAEFARLLKTPPETLTDIRRAARWAFTRPPAADYRRGVFDRADFARLAKMLRGIKGRFILSINDRPEIREMFGWAAVEEVETRCSANARANRRVTELLVSGGGGGG